MNADPWRALQFRLRARVLGRLKLRPGLPGARELTRTRSESELRYYSLLLSSALRDGRDVGALVDVGCRNGSYLPALAAFFPEAEIIGNELDPGRRYWNLWRRGDFAKAHAKAVPRARFVPGDFRALRGPDLPQKSSCVGFTFFYPFVSRDPCRAWGLPSEFADFPALLEHARKLARETSASRAWILSAHQGEWEAEVARDSYASAGLKAEETQIEPSRFAGLWPNPYPVYLFLTHPL